MKVLLRLVGYAFTNRALFIVTAVVMASSIVPKVAIPRLAGNAIDEALTGAQGTLVLIVGQIVLAGIARAILGYLALYMAERVGRVTEYRLRNDFFDKLQGLNFGFYDRQKTGDLMSRATVDLEASARFVSFGVLHGVSALTSYILPIAVMISIEWRLGLAALACFVLITGIGISLAARLYWAFQHVFRETGRMNTVIQEGLAGMRTVKVLGSQEYEVTRFSERASAVASHSIIAGQLSVTRGAVLMFLFAMVIAGILLFGGWQVQQGTLTPGALASFVLYMVMLSDSIGGFEGRVRLFARGMAAGERVFEILDAKNPLEVPEKARDLSASGHVVFDSVSFEYDQDVPALHDVDFELPPGQSAAIVGSAGSGKSTIAHLLPRFYDVSAGRVLIDGTDVREVTLESLRRSVGIVLQDVFAFSATITRQHRLRGRRRVYGRHRESGESRPAPWIHRGPAGWVRDVGGRARHNPVRRPAAEASHRQDHTHGYTRPDPRRLHVQRGRRYRDADTQGDGERGAGKDVLRHRSQAVYCAERGRDPGARPRQNRRAGHSRRPDGGGWILSQDTRPPASPGRGDARVQLGCVTAGD